MRLRWLFLCLFYATSAFAEPVRIGIYGGLPRLGYGDIASNLIMAQKIAAWPNVEVTIIVPDAPAGRTHVGEPLVKVNETLPILLPSFHPYQPVQKIGGIRFVLESSATLPSFDYFFAFSMATEAEIPARVFDTAPVRFLWTEYYPFDGTKGWDVKAFTAESGAATVSLRTGPRNSGLYVTEQTGAARVSRSETIAELNRTLRSHIEGISVPENCHLAFSYAAYSPGAQLYLDAVSLWARDHNPDGKEVVVVMRRHYTNPQHPNLHYPKNVRVVHYDSLPMDLHKKLISVSDLAPQVTGDGTLTFAVESGRYFIYEMLTHKEASVADLANAVLVHSKNGVDYRELHPAIVDGWTGANVRLVGDDSKRFALASRIAPHLGNRSLDEKVGSILSRIRPAMSLPDRLYEALQSAQELGEGASPEQRAQSVSQSLQRESRQMFWSVTGESLQQLRRETGRRFLGVVNFCKAVAGAAAN